MPTLPTFEDVHGPASPQPAGGVAAYQAVNWRQVGQVGYAVKDAANELGQAQHLIEATNDRQDHMVAEAALNNLEQQRVNLQFNTQDGFANVKEGATVGPQFVKGYSDRFDTAVQGISDGLQNDQQRQLFQQRAAVSGLHYKAALLEHQARQTQAFNDTTDNNTVELTLRSMAQRPTDELSFQSGLARINATVDARAKRNGWIDGEGQPNAIATEMKGKLLDAAYSTRILSVLNGIPGVTQASPYLAEKMFEQTQDRLGPQAQVQLAAHVLSGIKDVQMRDGARSEVFGAGTPDARTLYQVVDGAKPLQAVVKDLESRGQRYDKSGQLLTSSAGAQGEMQVLPMTQTSPGFGVKPADLSGTPQQQADEIARVGRDYVGAMVARYQDPGLALAAYNAGPGKVDQWLAKYGDPRTGQVTMQDWLARVPFAETRDYVVNGMKKMGADITAGPTARQVKAEALPALLSRARDHAEAMYPGDPKFADGYVARVQNYANQVLLQQTAKEQAASDTLTQSLLGPAGDGKNAPATIDQALADPTTKTAYEGATPAVREAYIRRLAQGDKRFDADSIQLYYGLLGKAGSDPEAFVKENLASYFGQMPDEKLQQLMLAQKSINAKDAKQQSHDLNWQHARSNVEDMLKPIGLGATAKPKSPNAVATEQFYGRLNEAMQQYHDTTQKWPDTQTTRKMAASLLTQGAVKDSGWLFNMGPDKGTRLFQSEDQSKFYVPLPAKRSGDYSALVQQFTRVMGHTPSDAELQQAYTRYKLSGGK